MHKSSKHFLRKLAWLLGERADVVMAVEVGVDGVDGMDDDGVFRAWVAMLDTAPTIVLTSVSFLD